MKSEGSVEIDCSIGEVFRLTNDHVPEWSEIVTEDQVLEEKPGNVGTTFRTLTVSHGRQMEFEGVVTKYEEPYSSAIHMTSSMFDMDIEYRFEELSATRTRVTQISNVQAKGLMKVFFALFGWAMNKANCEAALKELEGLKRFCESTNHQ